MGEPTLLALAMEVQTAHAQLAAELGDCSEQARYLTKAVAERLATLIEALRGREQKLEHLHGAIADRMNNLLMAISTASDLLRTTDDGEAAARVCEHLDATVETGRQSVKRLRESLGPLH